MTPVLIVGSGPTGLTLAIDLARRGVAVRIIEKSPAFPRSSRAKGPNQRSLEVLADLGVADAVLALGESDLIMRKYRDGVAIADTDPFAGNAPTPDVPYDRTCWIAQWQLEQVLRDRLAEYGVQVELGAELTTFAQDSAGVTAQLADGRTIAASYLVGCDGAHSPVRKLLGLAFDGHVEPEQVMVCGDVDVDVDGLDRGIWHQWFDTDGAVLLCPIPGTERSWWFQAGPERTADGTMVEPSLASFQRLFARHARRPASALTTATLLSTYRVNVRMVEHYRAGRVFLAGDAAHVHPIAGGLGMNSGIQDAFNLGWKLGMVATRAAGPALLDTYEEERLPVAAATLEITSDRLRAALEAIKEPGGGLDVVITKDTSNLGVGYRWSSLAGDSAAGPLQAGDRAPDAPCHAGDGAPVRLFELFAGPHFTLLGFGEGCRAAVEALDGGPVRAYGVDAGPGSLVDTGGHARRAYGVTGDALVLVRPDNHLATVAVSPEQIRAYLGGLG
ncbi:FAD-dependent monooxygenase [Pseudonocardia sp. GCM10023141]|uniref:FAD-dependent monooxygenase n=1 Tax=Pseudonocardia sp. GCM10023141 TaxID=3252653 RepID=UPI0036098CF9